MELLYDNKENKAAIYELWQRVFQDPEAFAEYYFQWVYPENQVILAREGNAIHAMLHLNPYRWSWERKEQEKTVLELHYIVGVATEEACRRQGLMAACMTRALQDMEANGEPFTYLMPARQEYYEPFQFVTIKKEKRWLRQGEHWLRKQEGSEAMLQEKKEGIPKGKFSILPERNPEYLQRLRAEVQCEGGGLLEWEAEASYCAYVMEERAEGLTAVIEQLVTDAGDTEQVLNRQVCPRLYHQYGPLPIEYMEEQPMMLRILKLSRFLELLPYEKEEKRCLVHLTDSICRENQGDFVITLSAKGCRLSRRTEQAGEGLCDLPEYYWSMAALTEYLLEESRLAEQMYLMEIV